MPEKSAITQYSMVISTSHLGCNTRANSQLFDYKLVAMATPIK